MAYTFNTELKSVGSTYAKLLDIKISQRQLKNRIEENPYYPSLLTLSDVFDSYNLKNSAYRISKEDFLDLKEEVPFVAYMRTTHSDLDFVVVESISDNKIGVYHKSQILKYFDIEDFLNRYKQVIWKVSENTKNLDPKFRQQSKLDEKNKYYKIISFLFVAALFLSFLEPNTISTVFKPLGLYFLTKVLGLFVTGLLIAYELDKNNSFVKNLCTLNSRTNCDAVLNSKASKLYGITWAEIGFCYFLSTVLILLNHNLQIEVRLTLVLLASLFASLYIIFSLFYQWKVVKQWCPLCLIIQLVLFFEVVLSIYLFTINKISVNFHPQTIIIALTSILFPIAILFLLKPIYISSSEHHLFRSAYKRLQYHPDIFNILLKKQEIAPDGWESIGIDIGNPDATNTIIKICNPFCGPCSESHPLLDEIISTNQDIKLKIIYIAGISDRLSVPVIKHFLAIRNILGTETLKIAMHDWYSSTIKDFETFAKKFPIPEHVIISNSEIEQMYKWCIQANVTHTPTVFFNGYKLPENYKIEDVPLII